MFNQIPDLVQEYIDLCLASDYAKTEEVVRMVPMPNRDERVTSERCHLLTHPQTTMKIERFEDFCPEARALCDYFAALYNHKGPVTAHIFNSPKDGFTFVEHLDPDDVVIYTVFGTKTMVIDGKPVRIAAGEHVFMKANTPHYATNEEASVMISIGLEKWVRDKL